MILIVFLFLLLQLSNDRRLEIELRKKSTMQQKLTYKLEPYLMANPIKLASGFVAALFVCAYVVVLGIAVKP